MGEEFGSNPEQAFPGHGQMKPEQQGDRAFGAEVNKRAVLQRYQASAGFAEFLFKAGALSACNNRKGLQGLAGGFELTSRVGTEARQGHGRRPLLQKDGDEARHYLQQVMADSRNRSNRHTSQVLVVSGT